MNSQENTIHQAIKPGNVAVITGAASCIGLAAAHRFGSLGMKVLLLDLPGEQLDDAEMQLNNEGIDALALPADVSIREQLADVKKHAEAFGKVSVLMSNAGREGGGKILAGEKVWR